MTPPPAPEPLARLPQLVASSASASPHAPLASLGSGLISAAVHLSCVLVLALWSASVTHNESLGWLEVGTPDLPAALAELPAPTFEAPIDSSAQPVDAAPLATAVVVDVAVLPGENTPLPLAEVGSPTSAGPVGAMSALVRELTTADTAKPQGGAEFYGIRASGNRFVYVVDCSSSMEGVRWQAARHELLTSLRRLGSERLFFVILFDGTAHPMYGLADLQHGLVPATAENIEKCAEWLNAHFLGNATSPYAAIRQALTLQPNAVFLLTDGDFNDPTAEFLRHNNVRRVQGKRVPEVAVHTVGFFTRKGQSQLQRIARDNGGAYQFIAEYRP